MPFRPPKSSGTSRRRPRPFAALVATWWVLAILPIAAEAQEAGAALAEPPRVPAASPPTQNAMSSLINRLVERGVLSKQDALELISQAEADAADSRVQAAETLLAAAKADAAVARAQAAVAQATAALARAQAAANQAVSASNAVTRVAEAQLAAARALLGQPAAAPIAAVSPNISASENTGALPQNPAPSREAAVARAAAPADSRPADQPVVVAAAAPLPAPAEAAGSQVVSPPSAVPAPSAPAERYGATPQVTRVAAPASASDTPVTSVDSVIQQDQAPAAALAPEAVNSPPALETRATPAPAESVVPKSAVGDGQEPGPVVASAEAAAADAPVPVGTGAAETALIASANAAADADGAVRVTYVPEVVKAQIREEVKDEVLAQARKENWSGTHPIPPWVSRFTLYGDLRVRGEGILNHSTNDNTGAFPNFNAVNTGAPFDVTGNVFSPQLNVDQNRERIRLRARVGAAVDLADGFTVGLRSATGNDNNPVTENQTLGAAGSGQGGNFGKYALWLDRAYLRYQSGGDASRNLSIYLGRFDNPFFATSLIWANDIGFDGAAIVLPAKVHVDGAVVDSVKPFIVAGAFPVFNTDLNFATNQSAKFRSYDKWLEAVQVGTTWKLGADLSFKTAAAYYGFNNIQGKLSAPFTPVTAADAGNTDLSRPAFAQNGNSYMELRNIVPNTLNSNGLINQWQYYGLASAFRDIAVTQRIDYNHFEPFQVSLMGEYVKNVAFNRGLTAAQAVNNLGPAPSAGAAQPFLGGNTGWFVNLRIGDAVLDQCGNWNIGLGYRRVESDAVVDGFNDSDFGGVLSGTNLKGFTLDANVALASSVWFEAKWMSAEHIAGPVYKNDLLQLDISGKF